MYEYQNPLLERYASADMSFIFSPQNKFSTWRKLWVALAEAEKELGLSITDEQIEEMRNHIDNIDFELARNFESKTRHDVMAHVYTYGTCCPNAKPIIHLGATSAFVGDNTDLIQMRSALKLILSRLSGLLQVLRDFALKYSDTATLGFTHFQPAQLTTVGKRASLWLYDLMLDFQAIENFMNNIPFLGVKGTTGTQASFLALFDGDHEKVKALDKKVSSMMGFEKVIPVSGQTYTRKLDFTALSLLSGLAQSLHKMANDIRLLQNLKEIEEPFEKTQIGSSAMAYKRNPMRSERMTSLCRYIISLCQSPAMTAAEQWFERTLDDSANKRLTIPEAFLAADACLMIAINVSDGLVVYPKVISKHIEEELPFMATENIIMAGVKKGGDRQVLHEQIRVHSMESARKVKLEGKPNDLLDRIASDPTFGLSKQELEKLLDVSEFVGRAPSQVREFIDEHIDPLLKRAVPLGINKTATVNV
ncbi:MAG TPA: adenylosuccinate lyase [Chitinispirillaceae bacterium]|jgi:adenylosuccinate lyase|nr:adenylosuccinate lyase [Chitinispirillaceae bacterium]